MAVSTVRVGELTVNVARPAAASAKPPVLLIHGMFGGAWYWNNYQRLFASRGYETHALNLRGHHGSGPPVDIGKVSLSEYVEDAMTVARSLGTPIVVGHSMGGLIAQKIAELGHARAAVLLAAAPPRWIPVISWLLLRKQLKYLPSLLMGDPLFPSRSDADALMFNRTPVAERDEFFAHLVPESGHAGLELSVGAVAVQESRVTAPMIVVAGDDDQFVVPRVARALARKYGAPLRTYTAFAHHIMCEPGWERPAQDIITWLDTTCPATPR